MYKNADTYTKAHTHRIYSLNPKKYTPYSSYQQKKKHTGPHLHEIRPQPQVGHHTSKKYN